MANSKRNGSSTDAAVQAHQHGYVPIPIIDGGKRPYGMDWTSTVWESPEQVTAAFDAFAKEGASGVGLLLGKPSGGLVDVDVDHVLAARLSKLLPPTAMRTGRVGRPSSHFWYRIRQVPDSQDPETLVYQNLPEGTRAYKMPDGASIIELRSTGGQTVIPPSVHPSKEVYHWEGEPWGGEDGPALIDGRQLALNVALLALNAVLLENWPKQGDRHTTYLALAGALLRHKGDVHPFWEKNLGGVVLPLADASHDDQTGHSRLNEILSSTVAGLREGKPITGWPSLGEVIGEKSMERAQRLVRDIESVSGYEVRSTVISIVDGSEIETPIRGNKADERTNSWQAVDLEPYTYGDVEDEQQSFLVREDGLGLLYDGKRNTLVGPSEQGKTWVALMACAQRIAQGDRVVFIDLEDSAKGFVNRLRLLGVGVDDILLNFGYINPNDPIGSMERDSWGRKPREQSDLGVMSENALHEVLNRYDPSLVVLDGTTSLYQLHGLKTNDNIDTDVIGQWLEGLTKNGLRTICQIDHTNLGGGGSSLPTGSQHKKATVTGSMINVSANLGCLIKGQMNLLTLNVLKDRPGAIREHCEAVPGKSGEQRAATVEMDSRQQLIRWAIKVPTVAARRGDPNVEVNFEQVGDDPEDLALQEKVLALLGSADALEVLEVPVREGGWVLTGDLGSALDVHGDPLRKAYDSLVRRRLLEKEGEHRWTRVRLCPT